MLRSLETWEEVVSHGQNILFEGCGTLSLTDQHFKNETVAEGVNAAMDDHDLVPPPALVYNSQESAVLPLDSTQVEGIDGQGHTEVTLN